MGIKSICHQNNSPVVCDGYVKYEEAEVDRLVAILKTNNCGINLLKDILFTSDKSIQSRINPDEVECTGTSSFKQTKQN